MTAGGARRWLSKGALFGAAVASAPLLVLLSTALWAPGSSLADLAGLPLWLAGAVACAVLVSAGGLAFRRSPLLGSGLAALAAIGFVALSVPALAGRPALALAILLPAAAAILRLFGPFRPIGTPEAVTSADPLGRRGAAIATSTAALLAWLLVVLFRAASGASAAALAFVSMLLAVAFGARWAVSERRLGRRGRFVLLGVAVVSGALAGLAGRHPELALSCLVPVPLAVLVMARGTGRRGRRRRAAASDFFDTLFDHPARLFSFAFLALIALGSFFLALPLCGRGGRAIAFIDAAFTATSATCVTGLTVVDTAVDFGSAGQVAILVLIQLGGLGVMTFYAAGLALLGRRLALKQEAAMVDILGHDDRSGIGRALAQVLVTTLAFELVGALALTGLFGLGGDPIGTAAWRGVFTSISAFCNAGFALASDNLVAYQRDPLVLHVVAILIVAGGLGPAVIATAPSLARGRRAPLTAKIVLSATAILLVGGAALFAAFEWNGALRGLTFLDKIHNAWFQSVTTRTAGFNSVDLSHMGPPAVTIFVALMFVGGSPGSTAGGIKTTTVALLAAAVRAALKGKPEVSLFGRHVPHFAVYKAAAIASLYAVGAAAAVIVLELTQRMDPQTAVFEVVSALGTVGLTIGGTARLDGVGKIAIMACMFLGRVGPLTLFMVLAGREKETRVRLPEEDVPLG